jgi:hypothetical protein
VIEALVDKAIASLLSTIPGLNVVVGMEDNSPNLTAPDCVVFSSVQKADGRTPIYELLTTIEYVSISGPDEVADVETTVTAIDRLLTTPPTGSLLTSLAATCAALGLTGCEWDRISRTQQDVGDRRRNIRELQVFAQAA